MISTFTLIAIVLSTSTADQIQNVPKVGELVYVELDKSVASDFSQLAWCNPKETINLTIQTIGVVVKSKSNGEITIQFDFDPDVEQPSHVPFHMTITTNVKKKPAILIQHDRLDGTRVFELSGITEAKIQKWALVSKRAEFK